ncbi:MAG: hypothetical protein JNJ59_15220, partial [Deltaproteobacteria bacterium]|nr:hypothetical protein [Deltaproteobacteria bacterium]
MRRSTQISMAAVAPDPRPGSASKLTLLELERRVQARVPEARLIDDHLVRRAVRMKRKITGLRAFVPHTHCVAIPTELLAKVATADELGGPLPEAPWTLVLPRPEAREVEAGPPERPLRATWRLLFHASLDRALLIDVDAGRLDLTRALGLVDRLGKVAFD